MGRMKNIVIMAECAGVSPSILIEDLRDAVQRGDIETPLTDEVVQRFLEENY
jgi:hypothetical protein